MNINQFFEICGGLGLFIFGIKQLSDSLQKASSSSIRNILSSITKNRFRGILSGTLITSLIQSSSGTTVIVVSLVNAGLLKLPEAISIIMGANIGTTFTAWIVSFFGFKFSINLFALPVISIGAVLYFIKGNRNKIWAEVLIGFGLLFLGLNFLKNGVPDIKSNPEVFAFLNQFHSKGIFSFFFFIATGTIITVIVQSSSATVALTITLAMKGWIPFESAAAMILGENLGTTITALLASIPANRMAKRAALSHTLFNVAGIIWMIFAFPFFINIVDKIWPGDPLKDIDNVRYHLSLFHSLFNITNTLLLVWFIPIITNIVNKLIKQTTIEENYHLKYIGTILHENPEFNLVEASKETQRMGDIVSEMVKDTIEVMLTPNKKMGIVIDKINRYETITDMLEKEISDFLSFITRNGISSQSSKRITSIFNITNDLERIADHCTSLIKLAQRRYEKKITFTDEMFNQLKKITECVNEFIDLNVKNLNFKINENFMAQALFYENKINQLRDKIKKEHTKLLIKGEEAVISGIVLMDMINNLERIGDHSFNLSEAICGQK